MATTTEVLSSANDLLASHAALISRVRSSQQANRRQLHSLIDVPEELLRLPLIPSPPPPDDKDEDDGTTTPPASPAFTPLLAKANARTDLTPAKRARVARYRNYVPEEETIRNDYSQRYVDGGEWPQNWVLGAEPERRFEEYPKQQKLLALKKASVAAHSLPPYYLPYSSSLLQTLNPTKFDSILIDPPFSSSFTWDNLQALPIPSLAADPSFVFLWVGSGAGEGLERGREVLAKWGYRRCEDVVWIKTNKLSNRGPGSDAPTTSLFTRTKEHCLIGIRGTVRRSTDSWFVHCNVDTDVIIWEGDGDPMRKPPEMYTLIENFCLGTRRLEVFGRISSLRRGWVTVLGEQQYSLLLEQLPKNAEGQPNTASPYEVEGPDGGSATKWNREVWEPAVRQLAEESKAVTISPAGAGKHVVPLTNDVETLRPKSPFRPGHQVPQQQQQQQQQTGQPMPMAIPGASLPLPPRFANARQASPAAPTPMLPTANPLAAAMGGLGMGGPLGMPAMGAMGMGMLPDGTGMMFPGMLPGMPGMNMNMPMMPGMMFNAHNPMFSMDQTQFMDGSQFGMGMDPSMGGMMDPSQFMDQTQFMDPTWDGSGMYGGPMNMAMQGMQGMQGQWGNFQ